MRISAISYLNTAPLMWDFEHAETGKLFEVSYTIPSQCAAELVRGAADIGIIPSAAYTTIPDLRVIPGVAIASKQAVASILLVSTKPIMDIKSVALDSSSLTSVALTRILFEKYWKTAPTFTSHTPDLQSMLLTNDAALLIGDPALKVDRTKYTTWDLAEEWFHFTRKPFVFAFWAVRESSLKGCDLDLAMIFQDSRDRGLESANLNHIAKTWAAGLGMSEDAVRSYLTNNIYYFLDESCLVGLQLFYHYAYECRLLPAVPELRFTAAPSALVHR